MKTCSEHDWPHFVLVPMACLSVAAELADSEELDGDFEVRGGGLGYALDWDMSDLDDMIYR